MLEVLLKGEENYSAFLSLLHCDCHEKEPAREETMWIKVLLS